MPYSHQKGMTLIYPSFQLKALIDPSRTAFSLRFSLSRLNFRPSYNIFSVSYFVTLILNPSILNYTETPLVDRHDNMLVLVVLIFNKDGIFLTTFSVKRLRISFR